VEARSYRLLSSLPEVLCNERSYAGSRRLIPPSRRQTCIPARTYDFRSHQQIHVSLCVKYLLEECGRLKPMLRRLVTGFPPRLPGFEPGSGHVGLCWTKWHWGRVSPSTSGFPANFHSTNCSTFIIYHLGLVQLVN
jgi:hypothetical protein